MLMFMKRYTHYFSLGTTSTYRATYVFMGTVTLPTFLVKVEVLDEERIGSYIRLIESLNFSLILLVQGRMPRCQNSSCF